MAADGVWTAVCPFPGLARLRRFVGSRNRPLAALASGGPEIFPAPRAVLVSAAPTQSFLDCPLGNILARPVGRYAGPFLRSAAT